MPRPGKTASVDALRAAKTARNFYTAIVLHLVEISPKLQALQQQKTGDSRRGRSCGIRR